MTLCENLGKFCKPAVVPSLNHLNMADYNTVYEPSDDIFLMLDTVAHEFDNDDQNVSQKSMHSTLLLGE